AGRRAACSRSGSWFPSRSPSGPCGTSRAVRFARFRGRRRSGTPTGCSATTTCRIASDRVRYEIAHAVRGRLRVRYPVHWFARKRDVVESGLRGIPGIRSVDGNPTTGSVRILYDPFLLAEASLVDSLHELSRALDAPPRARPSGTSQPRIETGRIPLLNVLGSGAVFALTWLPVAAPLRALFVLASGL